AKRSAAAQKPPLVSLILLDGFNAFGGSSFFESVKYAQHLVEGWAELRTGKIPFELDHIQVNPAAAQLTYRGLQILAAAEHAFQSAGNDGVATFQLALQALPG